MAGSIADFRLTIVRDTASGIDNSKQVALGFKLRRFEGEGKMAMMNCRFQGKEVSPGRQFGEEMRGRNTCITANSPSVGQVDKPSQTERQPLRATTQQLGIRSFVPRPSSG
jgi:hypothetical protein